MTKKINTIDLVQDRPWAIYPPKLDDINAAILARINGQPSTFSAAKPEDAVKTTGYEVIDGVALISIAGTLFKRANLMMEYSGGTSYDLLKVDIASALSDNGVQSIFFDVDSPGGTVDGLADLAQYIREARGQKPMTAYADGMMCSAAYYLACQADTVLVSQTSLVGSIGTISMHYDYSENDKQWGIKRTAIAAGKFKAAGGDHQPLDEEAKDYLHGITNDYYNMFVADVVAARKNLKEKDVRDTEARVYVGKNAVETGLADAVATFDEAFAKAREQVKMDVNMLKAQHKSTYDAVLEEGKELARAEQKTAVEAAVKTERERAMSIVGLGGSHESTLKAITDGLDKGTFAIAVLNEERENKGKVSGIDALTAGLNKPVGVSGGQKDEGGKADFEALVNAHMGKNPGMTKSAAITAMAKANPDAYTEWLK